MIRLFVKDELQKNSLVSLEEKQIHYLLHVMRLKVNDRILLFNGHDGEYVANLIELSKNKAIACCEKRVRLQEEERDLNIWLCFAPIKKDNMDFVVQKATELGVSTLYPVITSRTVCKPNVERMKAQVIEAAEQCERLSVPQVMEPIRWDLFFDTFPEDRILYYLNERGNGITSVSSQKKSAFFIGPEGGFDPKELEKLATMKQAISIHLGRRILRAETASIVALACYNQVLGWKA